MPIKRFKCIAGYHAATFGFENSDVGSQFTPLIMTGHPGGPQMAHGHEVALNNAMNAYGRQFSAYGCDCSQHPTRDRRALVAFYAARLIEGIAIKSIRVLYHNPELSAWICKKSAIMRARPYRLGAP